MFFSLLKYLDCESIQSILLCEYTVFAWIHTNQEMVFEFFVSNSMFFGTVFLISYCIPINVDRNTGSIEAIWTIDIDENITVK